MKQPLAHLSHHTGLQAVFSVSMILKLQVSIVSQEPVLFNCSVEENIAYGFNGKASTSDIENVAVSFIFVFLFPFKKSLHMKLFSSSLLADEY